MIICSLHKRIATLCSCNSSFPIISIGEQLTLVKKSEKNGGGWQDDEVLCLERKTCETAEPGQPKSQPTKAFSSTTFLWDGSCYKQDHPRWMVPTWETFWGWSLGATTHQPTIFLWGDCGSQSQTSQEKLFLDHFNILKQNFWYNITPSLMSGGH